MKIHVLGTGHALALNNYNTCFVIEEQGKYMLVDAGGGNGIVKRLQLANLKLEEIDYAFCTHNHTDHVLGFAWIMRMNFHLYKSGKRKNPFTVYGSKDCLDAIKTIAKITLGDYAAGFLDNIILFKEVKNGEKINILGVNFEFFDTFAVDIPQLGFYIQEKDLAFCGDVPLNERYFEKFKNINYLCLEGLCSVTELKGGFRNKHFPIKNAAEVAENIRAKNLIIWHTADRLPNRAELYTQEAKSVYSGNVFVPNDLDVIDIG